QVDVALVLDLHPRFEILHEQGSRLAGDLGHGGHKGGRIRVQEHGQRLEERTFSQLGQQKHNSDLVEITHYRRGGSSAMYMISCLKMNKLGAPCRVRRTMFLS